METLWGQRFHLFSSLLYPHYLKSIRHQVGVRAATQHWADCVIHDPRGHHHKVQEWHSAAVPTRHPELLTSCFVIFNRAAFTNGLRCPWSFTLPPFWLLVSFLLHRKRWEYQTTWPASWEIYMQVRKQQLELDMEQQTGYKTGKEYIRLYIVILLI